MKPQKNGWVFLFIGICTLLSGIILMQSLVKTGVDKNGTCGMNKLVLTRKSQTDRQNIKKLAIADLKKLEGITKTGNINFVSKSGRTKTEVNYNGTTFAVNITGTNYLFSSYSQLSVVAGSFFTQDSETQKSLVAVINEELAWTIFKSTDVVGKNITIFGKEFKIVGVLRKDTSILGRLVDNGLPDVYIPGEKLLELDDTASISSFQLRSRDNDTMDNNRVWISNAMLKISQNASDYNISDYNIKKALLEQRPKIIVFVTGSIVIVILAIYIAGRMKGIFNTMKEECKTDYLTNAIRRNAAKTATDFARALIALFGILLLGAGIRFSLFIPPELIPNELIDVSYYMKLIKTGIQNSIENLGYVGNYSELYMNKLDMLTGWPMMLTGVVGFVMTCLGVKRINQTVDGVDKITIVAGVIILVSLFITAITSNVAGLKFNPEVKSILVVWAFIYIQILQLTEREGI